MVRNTGTLISDIYADYIQVLAFVSPNYFADFNNTRFGKPMQMSNYFHFLLVELILRSTLIRVAKSVIFRKLREMLVKLCVRYFSDLYKYNHVQVSFIRYIIPIL
jgi:hypothetical protein